ncbi:transposon-transfer assisting family protein [Lachnoclostridium sp. An76]|uniref:transposon-transfer assisting family protein n=1 Tax=Lachnoclostridium sp. An76 TaxID=1965654 RepID=UPI000B3AE622|nr:transposon-transfer assisting family protein [Lachnoclostridium sp. An76]OUN34182.1 hypothetical protein B5G27_08955 [Lachnoclostridium sp. An76]
MKIRFEEDEYFLMAMFQKESRLETMGEIRAVIPFVKEDAEILSLINNTLGKMEHISDDEFSRLDLEDYRQEPVEET